MPAEAWLVRLSEWARCGTGWRLALRWRGRRLRGGRDGRRAGVPGGESLAGKVRAVDGVRRIADEQAALCRGSGAGGPGEAPEEVFAAVAAEAGRVLRAQHAWIGRYHPDGTPSVIVAWPTAADALIPVGTKISSGGRNLITLVLQTGQPSRLYDYVSATGAVGTLVRESGIRASVGAPVSVEERLWGLLAVTSCEEPRPTGTQARLAAFTELAATAIANAEAQAALTASRARIVAAADAARRRSPPTTLWPRR